MQTQLASILFITLLTVISGCSSGLLTEVRTVSDAMPLTDSSYALVYSGEQAADIESKRLAQTIRANMIKQGFVEKEAEAATYHVQFALAHNNESRNESSNRVELHRSVSHVSTSQASVAGIGVPGTQRTTVHRETAPSYGHMNSSRNHDRASTHYRLEISFLANDDAAAAPQPVHKMVVESQTSRSSVETVGPCLVDAAFRNFPNTDGTQRSVRISDCSQ